jgi:photosystem II stability/assembly factor-like uncharacterized protein
VPPWIWWFLGLVLVASGCRGTPGALPEQGKSPGVRPERAVLLGVARAGPRLVAVGERGIVVLSDDQGRTWRKASVPTQVTLVAVQFPSPRRGYAVGHLGTLLRSDDAGESWVVQRAPRGEPEPPDPRDEASDPPWLDVHFSSEDRGIVVGAFGSIIGTDDGGRTWTSWQTRLEPGENRHLYAVRATGATIFVAGEQGAVYRSDDGGAHFNARPTPYEGSYFGLLLGPAPAAVTLFGLRGTVVVSADGGATWQMRPIAGAQTLVAGLVLADGSALLADQAGQLFRSVDRNREAAFSRLPSRLPAAAQDLVALDNGQLLVVGARGIDGPIATEVKPR